ncbi:MAG: hypothetical protein QOE03_4000, partial [Micromonosporaceae bacterium]|nr:hypothetical protein [Micromonosporaceae bacterium]
SGLDRQITVTVAPVYAALTAR